MNGAPLDHQPADQSIEVAVKVSGAGDLEAVEVCRNNEFIYKKQGQGSDWSADLQVGRLSSPVWLGD